MGKQMEVLDVLLPQGMYLREVARATAGPQPRTGSIVIEPTGGNCLRAWVEVSGNAVDEGARIPFFILPPYVIVYKREVQNGQANDS